MPTPDPLLTLAKQVARRKCWFVRGCPQEGLSFDGPVWCDPCQARRALAQLEQSEQALTP